MTDTKCDLCPAVIEEGAGYRLALFGDHDIDRQYKSFKYDICPECRTKLRSPRKDGADLVEIAAQLVIAAFADIVA